MDNLQLEYLSFKPVKKAGSLIGFISFKIGREYSWYQVGVHKLKVPKDTVRVRLLYPERQHPETTQMQQEIDESVNAYLTAQYPEALE